MTLQPRILVVACAAVLMVSLYVVLECSTSAPGSAADFSLVELDIFLHTVAETCAQCLI